MIDGGGVCCVCQLIIVNHGRRLTETKDFEFGSFGATTRVEMDTLEFIFSGDHQRVIIICRIEE